MVDRLRLLVFLLVTWAATVAYIWLRRKEGNSFVPTLRRGSLVYLGAVSTIALMFLLIPAARWLWFLVDTSASSYGDKRVLGAALSFGLLLLFGAVGLTVENAWTRYQKKQELLRQPSARHDSTRPSAF